MTNNKKTEGKTSTVANGVTEIAERKQAYIDAWNSHIKSCYMLCLNGNQVVEEKVSSTIKQLLALVPQVADAKESKGCTFEGSN